MYGNSLQNYHHSNATGSSVSFQDFTQFTIAGGSDYASPLIGNLYGDSKNEIVIFINGNTVYIFKDDLTQLTNNASGSISSFATLYDTDSDGYLEIVGVFSDGTCTVMKNIDYSTGVYNATTWINMSASVVGTESFTGTSVKCYYNSNNARSECIVMGRYGSFFRKNIGATFDYGDYCGGWTRGYYNAPSDWFGEHSLRYLAPAIGDINTDGKYEAIFLCDNNSDQSLGIVGVDIGSATPSLLASFGSGGFIDNINPVITNPIIDGQKIIIGHSYPASYAHPLSIFNASGLFWDYPSSVSLFDGADLVKANCKTPTIKEVFFYPNGGGNSYYSTSDSLTYSSASSPYP
jgi:hypothetical protein